jgi:1,2-diacylglycerol 3-alpha-glucosyltransferase
MTPQRNQPLKIAFFVEGMYASGVDTSTQLLARALRRLGQRVVIFSPWKDHAAEGEPDEMFLLPALNVNTKQKVQLSYPVSWRLITEFKRQQFDIIHVHTSSSVNLLAWQVSKLFKLPIIYTYHTLTKEYLHYWAPLAEHMGSFLDGVVELYDKVICDRANLVLTPSAKAADYLNCLKVTPPVEIVPNGIDLDRFYPYPSDYLQTQLGVPAEAKVLLFVGRLNQEKRPLLAYDLFRKLSHQREDICLVMVGEGPLRDQLAQMAVHDNLKRRLFLPGLIDYATMPAIYNSAHIWISTSLSEVHPMVALEAAACGLPAVAFNDPALHGIVDDGVNGYRVNRNEAFLQRLNQILDNSDLYHAMRRAAASKGEAYSVETTAKRLLQCYQRETCPKQPPGHDLEPFHHRRLIKLG